MVERQAFVQAGFLFLLVFFGACGRGDRSYWRQHLRTFTLSSEIALVGRQTVFGSEWLGLRRNLQDSVGVITGDSVVRLRIWPSSRASAEALSLLCGAIALHRVPLVSGDARALPASPVGVDFGVRSLDADEPIGVRWIVPGTQAQYRFEGVTRDGQQRVSFRWPVRADSSIRIPVGAPDSVIEAALRPSPDSLDAFVQRVASIGGAGPLAVRAPDAAPRQVDAVSLVSDLPFYVVPLSSACPTATFRLTVLARTDQRVRIPVKAGDEVDGFASAEYGAVQLWFEEAGPPTPNERFATIPRARVIAAADGVVTAHLTLLTVSKQQRPDQEVLLRLTRRRP